MRAPDRVARGRLPDRGTRRPERRHLRAAVGGRSASVPSSRNGGPLKAIVQDRYGAPEQVLRLDELEPPHVADGDVLVRVRASSVNTPDWITVSGVPYVL